MKWFFFASCLFATTPATSQDSGPAVDKALESAVKSYQLGQFQDAQKTLQTVLEQNPRNSLVLYNLGLAEYKLGRPGLALGLWRKALVVQPNLNQVREALAYALLSLPHQETLGGGSLMTWVHERILSFIETDWLCGFLAATILIFGWSLLGYLGGRKRALESESPLPRFPFGVMFSGFFLLLSTSMLGIKLNELNKVKATLIAKRADVKSGPSTEAATLFEILEGNEVLVRKSDGDWVQVSYSTGQIGWVPRDTLFLTSGRESW